MLIVELLSRRPRRHTMPEGENRMSTTTLIIVILVVLFLFGGFGYRRWRR
jgi:hypothetical protein